MLTILAVYIKNALSASVGGNWVSNLPMWAVGAEDHMDIEPSLRYQGKLCSVSEHPIPQTPRKLFASFQELE